jgi:propanol-preferring alcohol dehydrogenase
MRALLLDAPGPAATRPLRLVHLPDPRPARGEILIRVTACAVCRTDLQLAEGDLELRRRPLVPGHQAVGRVAAVGEGVRDWTIGDRAGVGWLGGADGTCDHCRASRENLCAAAEFTGWDRHGGFAELMVARADFAFHLPDGFEDLAAAPLLCGGVIGYRALKRAGVTPGARVGLYGFGASALLALQVARSWGCEVFVVTRSLAEQQRALELGAAWAAGYDEPPPVPLDAAVTFAPVGSVVVAALRALAPGATVAINAIHLDTIPEFSYDLLWRERGICSVANFTRSDAREFLDLAAAIPIRTVVDPFPLADGNQALERLARGDIAGAAVLTMGA